MLFYWVWCSLNYSAALCAGVFNRARGVEGTWHWAIVCCKALQCFVVACYSLGCLILIGRLDNLALSSISDYCLLSRVMPRSH